MGNSSSSRVVDTAPASVSNVPATTTTDGTIPSPGVTESTGAVSPLPDNYVGILAMEVYFPSFCVDQKDLEVYNEVSSGKYTIGLGQDKMAFTGDREDINSICLTAVHNLLEKYNIDPMRVGRLEVGTESLIDKSKSTKTVLMSLFPHTDIEGATVVNACYGGTAALLNALLWADGPSWDGRYAIVVAADIAVYAEGAARPSGGCGAVAMLIGRNAPLAVNLRTRITHASHTWDFFKPNMDSEYPIVNGGLSQNCFLRALDDCYHRFITKAGETGQTWGCSTTDHFLFHSPYNKLVQKSFARIVFSDMLNGRLDGEKVSQWKDVPMESTYDDKALESVLKDASASLYSSKVGPSCAASKLIGNTYTAAVYFNLANLVSLHGADLAGRKVLLFSYGSGALASMFEIRPRLSHHDSVFSLANMQRVLDLPARLLSREVLPPSSLDEALLAREHSHRPPPFLPTYRIDRLFPGTYYIEEVKSSFERIYGRLPIDASRSIGGSMTVCATEPEDEDGDESGDLVPDMVALDLLPPVRLTRAETVVWASGRPNINVVVTGVSAAVPGRDKSAQPSVENIRRIIAGDSFISSIPDEVKLRMLNKNVQTLARDKDGIQTKHSVSRFEDTINVSGAMGSFDLTSYGVTESLASTMDSAVQVAVAAGLEALRDAGIVSGLGEGSSGWILPVHFQDTTGVVYATSFPALDAAIAEVSKFFSSKSVEAGYIPHVIAALKLRLEKQKGGPLSVDCEEALELIGKEVGDALDEFVPYEFDRKFLFRVLVLGNAQLAQIIKARGPNMQTNAACAGATQAVALAYDMIQVGRAERVIVIAGDNAASDTLMPWLGNGFRALGAACIQSDVALAALPFDRRRTGMILGSGGIGIVLESEDGARRRHALAIADGAVSDRAPFRCRLLGTLISNSAFHGASMDKDHIASEMERFISAVESERGISRSEIARNGVYFSHETCTHASPTSSCAFNELHGLRQVFKEDFKHMLILNTKGFTGHPMGVSFEDVVAAEVLVSGNVPPIANFEQSDPNLGEDINLSKGGYYKCKYAIRFAAGFGSQIALALYGSSEAST